MKLVEYTLRHDPVAPDLPATDAFMTDGNRVRAYSDISVLVVSTSAVLSAAMAAGLAAIGWLGARPVVTGAWVPAVRPSEAPTVVFVADETGVLPEPSLVFSDDAETVVVVAPPTAAVSLLPMCERGATVVDGDLPLQAQLRAVDLALGGSPSIQSSTVGWVRSWAEDLHLFAGLTRREGEVLDLIICGTPRMWWRSDCSSRCRPSDPISGRSCRSCRCRPSSPPRRSPAGRDAARVIAALPTSSI